MEETPPPSTTSDKNPWPVMEDQSSSRDGSRRWPDWNTRESLKCEDTSEWPSWECSQGNRDIQKGDTMDTEVFATADSSLDEQRGRGRLREINRDGGWNCSAKRHSEMSKRNSWNLTKDHSSSRNGHSHRWPDCDALNSSKCKDDSGWPSWECFRESNDTHDDDTVDREVHTVSKYTFDEQRNMKLEYLDQYLIHFPSSLKLGAKPFPPNPDDVVLMDIKSVWTAMEECQTLGLAKTIGVTNFSCKKLSDYVVISV